MSDYKHNTVYKITNTINGRWYIGVHSTDNLNDGYMGSGVLIKQAIAKYGQSVFKKEIMYDFKSLDEAYQKESELVTVEVIKDPSSYNLMTGGYAGQYEGNITYTHVNTKDGWVPKEAWDPEKYSGHNKDKVIVRDSQGNKFAVNREDPRYLNGELVPWNKDISPSYESNLKRAETLKNKPKYPKVKCDCGQMVSTQPSAYKRHQRAIHHLKKINA